MHLVFRPASNRGLYTSYGADPKYVAAEMSVPPVGPVTTLLQAVLILLILVILLIY